MGSGNGSLGMLLGTQWTHWIQRPKTVLNLDQAAMQIYWAFAAQDYSVSASEEFRAWIRRWLGFQGFLVDSVVKNLPAVQETWVRSLGGEDPLETEMATHSSILAWRIPWTGEPGRLQSLGPQRVGHDWVTIFLFSKVADLHLFLLKILLPTIFFTTENN